MSDVAAIIDRLYRTYLYPPDARPAQCFLDGAITNAATSLTLSDFVLPEDEELLAAGVLLEIASELIQVTAYDELNKTATVIRGFLGTTAAAHSDNDPVYLSPPFTRLDVFNAVADNILTLYPRLYTVSTVNVSTVGAGVAPIHDALAVEVIEVWADDTMGVFDVDARIVDFHPNVGGRGVITNVHAGSIWVKYRRRMGDAATEAATWADLGFEERWANIVMAGAAADLFAGRDLSASHTEWVGAALQAENIPVGTRSSLARNLAAYREHLLTQASKEMRAEYRSKVHTRPASQVVTRSAFG